MRLEIGDTEKVAKSLTEETRAWGNFTFLSGMLAVTLSLSRSY